MTWRPTFLLAVPAWTLVLFLATTATAPAIEIQRVISPGGIEAWLMSDRTNPIIALRIAFRGGAALDPENREGLANMVSSLLDEGAGELDSQAFQGRLDDLSISFRFDAGYDSFGGRVRTLTANRDTAFELLRLALTAPRFDDEPVERIRSQLEVRLKRDSEDPDRIAGRTLFATLFPDHPYGRPVRGTLESIAAITVGELRGFVASRLARDNLVVGVVGDIDAGELGPLLDATFGGLPEKAAPWLVAEVEPKADGTTVVVRKSVPQSAIVFGQPGIKRDHPDFYAAFVMNHVLGGGSFTSRLREEIREKRGLAYSVFSNLLTRRHTGLVMGAAGTANASVAETLRLVRQEWQRMAAEGVSALELADTKTYLTGSYPLRFSSSPRIASILVGVQLEYLGIDYIERRNGYIEAVTLDQVNRVARQLLDPAALTTIVVGEPEGVESTP